MWVLVLALTAGGAAYLGDGTPEANMQAIAFALVSTFAWLFVAMWIRGFRDARYLRKMREPQWGPNPSPPRWAARDVRRQLDMPARHLPHAVRRLGHG